MSLKVATNDCDAGSLAGWLAGWAESGTIAVTSNFKDSATAIAKAKTKPEVELTKSCIGASSQAPLHLLIFPPFFLSFFSGDD